jgi:hypothetical protein
MHRRAIALALLLWYVPACTSWHVEQGVDPQQLVTAQHPKKVRVTLPDRSQLVLDQPNAAGDSLTGLVDGKAATVATADVRQIATRKASAGRTVLMVVGLGVVAAGIALLHAISEMCLLSC